jgi:DNA-binding NarL/FixJ family response regulator
MIKVLIIEDHEEFRTHLKSILYGMYPDMVIAEAGDGADAMRQLALVKPDVVFVDINLPGEFNGLKIVCEIRALHDKTEIIVITNHDLPEYREASLNLGANYFLPKASTTTGDIRAVMKSVVSALGGGTPTR